MHVLLIRSDLPESPEVLLLSGLLSANAAGWVPSPEAITCKLVKLWAWVAEHGAADSDSADYLVPFLAVAPLEAQLGCPGLIAAMSNPGVDWCAIKDDRQQVAFRRFAEWNGPDAMKRRGDATRAKRSRDRSKGRILTAPKLGSGRERPPKSSAKAHANCDARHVSQSKPDNVDVDVLLELTNKTSTSTSHLDRTPPETSAADPPLEPIDPQAMFARIRDAFRSPHNADADAVAADRSMAWKTACIVAERLGAAWLERVIATAAKQKLRRPYAYLWGAVGRRLRELDLDANTEAAMITAPPPGALEAMDTAPPRQDPPTPRPPAIPDRDVELRRFRGELLRRGVKGDALVAAMDDFDNQLSQRFAGV